MMRPFFIAALALLAWVGCAAAQQMSLTGAGKGQLGGGGSGSLSGVYANLGAGPTAINLTTLTSGGTDYLGLGYDGTYGCYKATGGQVITYPTIVGGATVGGDAQAWTWSTTDAAVHGTCVATETQTTGLYYGGAAGAGFSVTVPAGTSPQVVTFYAGNDSGETLNITATLSDSSASPYTNSSCTGGSGWIGCRYTITYNAASSSQTLTVKGVTTGTGYVGLGAVVLAP